MKNRTANFRKKPCYYSIYFFLVLLISPYLANANQVAVIPLVKNHISAIKPSEVIELGTTAISANDTKIVVRILPDASNAGTYTVPNNKVLVITNMIINPQTPVAGQINLTLIQNSTSRRFFVVPSNEPTTLFFGPGLLISAGYSLEIRNGSTSDSSIRVIMFGYETGA